MSHIIKEVNNSIVCLHDGKVYQFANKEDRLKCVTFSEQFDKLPSADLRSEIQKGMAVNTIIIKDDKAYFNKP